MTDKNITVYSTPTCPYCRQAKEFLQERGVAFTDLNVATDLEARNAMVQKSGQLGVPVIEVDGNIVIGFNKSKLEELISQ
ncbi:MAG: glutaredoxin family protein [Armatimonadota bacterium]|nr:glutaredoxin family protein [bacterium]